MHGRLWQGHVVVIIVVVDVIISLLVLVLATSFVGTHLHNGPFIAGQQEWIYVDHVRLDIQTQRRVLGANPTPSNNTILNTIGKHRRRRTSSY